MTKDYLGRDVMCRCGKVASTLLERHEHDGTLCDIFRCDVCDMTAHVHHVPQPDPEMQRLLYSERSEEEEV